jgi:hypothetical protein
MADEGREPTKPRDGVRSGSQVKGLDPFGGNSTGSDEGYDQADDPIHDSETTIEDSFAGGGIAHGGRSSARGTGGTGIGIDGTGLGGTAGGEGDHDLDFGGSIPE